VDRIISRTVAIAIAFQFALLLAIFQNYRDNLPSAVCVNPIANWKSVWSIPRCTAHNVNIRCPLCQLFAKAESARSPIALISADSRAREVRRWSHYLRSRFRHAQFGRL